MLYYDLMSYILLDYVSILKCSIHDSRSYGEPVMLSANYILMTPPDFAIKHSCEDRCCVVAQFGRISFPQFTNNITGPLSTVWTYCYVMRHLMNPKECVGL